MKASLILAAHNEGDRLWRTVKSCIETTSGLDCEIVVADDASTDDSVDALRQRYPEIPVWPQKSRLGASPTKGLAARHAAGDILVFLDAHTKPEPGALKRVVEDVAAVGGEAIVTPAVPALDSEQWENKLPQIGNGYRITLDGFECGWVGCDAMKERGAFYESPALIGCCAAMTRDLYDDLWGFDPDMRQWGVEDIDFGLKAWLMGYSILHDPRALVGHRFRAAFDNYSVSMENLLVNQIRMARKNFTQEVWEVWLDRFRARHVGDLWERTWQLFLTRRDSVEREREYLLSRRKHDEFWYAERFGLDWPQRGAS